MIQLVKGVFAFAADEARCPLEQNTALPGHENHEVCIGVALSPAKYTP
jgi:hypothetical protein